MSLEECKRLAEEKLAEARARAEIQYSDRRARGWIDDRWVEIALYAILKEFPFPRESWIVAISPHKHFARSRKEFPRKESAEEYFEELTRKYGFKEEEK